MATFHPNMLTGPHLSSKAPRHFACPINRRGKVLHDQLPSWAIAASLQETIVEFRNQRGERLVGTLVDPSPPALPPSAESRANSSPSSSSSSSSKAAATAPVVILAHGYMSSRNSELLVRLATVLASSCQVASFRFDFSGNGDSEGDFRYGQYRWVLQPMHVWGVAPHGVCQLNGDPEPPPPHTPTTPP
jgi:hypothetical protein